MATISNSNSTSITGLSSEGKSTVSFTGEAGLMFSDYFGISSGIGFSSLKSEILLATYNRAPYDTFDATESYKRSINGTNIKEIQQISFLKIPLLVNIKIPLGKNVEIYFNPGVNFSLPVSKKYSGSGTFTYDGFYSAYNVHITGVPYEGLEKDYSTSDEGGLLIKSFNAGLTASAGVHYSIQENVQIGIGFAYEKLLSDISDYADSKDFTLSSKPNQMRSIMEGSSGATASSFGLRISFRILL
jgi:opacity protein-like surface antigen